MNEFNEYEYTVSQKSEGKWKRNRILMVLFYAVFGLVFFFGFFALHLYPLMALVILAEWILVFFTWGYVSLDYKITTGSGRIDFINIYGGRRQKIILEKNIRDFDIIAPLDGDAEERLKKTAFAKSYDFTSSVSATDRYYATFKDETGKDCVVCFEATQKLLKILRYYNPSTVIGETRY